MKPLWGGDDWEKGTPIADEMYSVGFVSYATIARTATVLPPNHPIPDGWSSHYTLAATATHGGYTLYQDRGGRWFRVNSEPVQ